MPDAKNRPLKVFLCHASDDKPLVRDLYRQLCAEGWMDVWLDEEKLLPGQEWDLEIEKAVEAADVVLVTLSTTSVDKEGYIQRELRYVLNLADQKPEGAIFIIPIRLNDCPAPRRLRNWQYVDYFPKDRRKWAYERILQSLKLRAERLGISLANPVEEKIRLEAEERARREAVETARKKEQEERKRKSTEERAGSALEKPAQINFFPEPKQERSMPDEMRQPRKVNWRWLGITGLVSLVLVCGGIGVNYGIANWPFGLSFLSTKTPTMTTTKTPSPTSTVMITPNPMLGIGSTWTRPADGMVMVYVPEGDFIMGSDNGSSDEQPAHTVYLDSFWIDQNEVTNQMYALCVAAGQCDSPDSSSSYTHSSYYGDMEFDDYPVISVSWNDASAYCAWAGGDVYGVRLPTEAEWEKAARGEDGRTYPWGEGIDCQKANYGGCVGDTSPVRSYASGISPYEVYDMAGNVWEWVADWYDVYPGGDPNAFSSFGQTYRVLRGGSWYFYDGNIRSAYRNSNSPTFTLTYIGFRCSRSP